ENIRSPGASRDCGSGLETPCPPCLRGSEFSSLDAVRVEAGPGRVQPGRGADVVPLAVMHDRAQAAGAFGAVVGEVQRGAPVGDAVEEPAVEELDAGEDIGRDLAFAAPPRNPQRIEKIIAAALVP